jgi:CRP-like cAMP-binding protein
MTANRGPTGLVPRNAILAALPTASLEALRPHLNQVTLTLGQVLHEPDSPIADVFFVQDGVVSLTADTFDNGQVEVGLIGREGLVGISAILNAAPLAVHRAFTQVPGSALRIAVPVLRSMIEQSPKLRDSCLRYVEMLTIQTSQVVACNTRHLLPERLARWLLMVRDRTDSDDLPMTQEFLSVMLGVRRPGVSVAASTLQAGGLIHQLRGHIRIANHDGLVAASCECYRMIASNQARILPGSGW